MQCMYFTDAMPTEPLCWEEQLNSNQVKLLKQSKPSMPTKVSTHSGETGIRPVVFHEKRSVEEMLKQQKVRFHLSSCHLPDLKSKKSPEKDLLSGKTGKQVAHKKSSPNNQLELKGSGLKKSHYKTKFVNGNWKFPEELDVGSKSVHEKRYKATDFCNHASRLHAHCSPKDISRIKDNEMERETLCTNEYVEIPFSLPNPALTDESCSIISDGRDLTSERISFEKSDKFNKTSSATKSAENEMQDKSSENADEQTLRKSVTKIAVPLGTSDNDFELRRKECYSGPGYNTPRESRMSRQSSRFTYSYTPSTPPLFLSNDILEFPKGVSPSKALLELRQTFCENIRRETEQLEFDLQELYLKKRLHQR